MNFRHRGEIPFRWGWRRGHPQQLPEPIFVKISGKRPANSHLPRLCQVLSDAGVTEVQAGGDLTVGQPQFVFES